MLINPEIVKRHGYPLETHQLLTEDGYILTIFRIPYGRNSTTQEPGSPVFLQHGILLSCMGFVDMGPNSLGFVLADAGYDVWLGNFRGSKYARNHITLDSSSKEFWDFSFTENGLHDLPAQLNRVTDFNNEKIIYIGFSMGSTAAYIYGAQYPDMAYEKIKIFISLAPIAFVKHVKTVTKFIFPLWKSLGPILKDIFHVELTPQPALIKLLCLPCPFQMKIYHSVLKVLFGFDYPQQDPRTLPIMLLQNLDTVSVKTVSHYLQLVESGKFEYYDYGLMGNRERYGNSTPTQYDLSKIKVPNYLIRGNNDLLATKENVEQLNDALPERAKPYPIYVIEYNQFMHSDFLAAKDVVPMCYNHILDFISYQ